MRAFIAARVRMNGKEEIGLRPIRNRGPLFEREDFERLLEPAIRKANEDAATKPVPQASPLVPVEDGITISRGAVASLAVLMVVLLAMAFATGYLVGTQ